MRIRPPLRHPVGRGTMLHVAEAWTFLQQT